MTTVCDLVTNKSVTVTQLLLSYILITNLMH